MSGNFKNLPLVVSRARSRLYHARTLKDDLATIWRSNRHKYLILKPAYNVFCASRDGLLLVPFLTTKTSLANFMGQMFFEGKFVKNPEFACLKSL